MATTLRSRTVLVLGLVVLASAVLLLADVFTADGAGVATDVELVMEDYRFDTDEITLPAGEPVTLVFDNRDEVTHSVSFGRTVTKEGDRVVGFAEDLLADVPVRVVPGSALTSPAPPYTGLTVVVHGGERVTVEMTVPESRTGEWQIGCFTGLGCHYQAGLAASLIVE